MGITEKISHFIVETGYKQIPKEGISNAKMAILDCLGCALAGSRELVGKKITEYVKEIGGRPEATIIGAGCKTSAAQAALANGTLAHALDYDDYTAGKWPGHPTAPVLPVVLALGEKLRISGKEALESYILGVEVEGKIGSAIGVRNYELGWHTTAIAGTIGATAAAAKILKLTPKEIRIALAIAASEASGLVRNFGTMSKPLHAGLAARNGIEAALLARGGFTANESIIEGEGPNGFCLVFCGGSKCDLEEINAGLGLPFDIVHPGFSVKLYPCCALIHRCIDAILYLIKKYKLSPEEVAEVKCRTGAFIAQDLIYSSPKRALEGKFSMQYCMAIALLDGEVGLKQFTDEKVSDPKVQNLIKKVRYVHPKGVIGMVESERLPEAVTVRMLDGKEYQYEVKVARGYPQNPISEDELASKYRHCAGLVLSAREVELSLELISNLETLDNLTNVMDVLYPKT